MKRTHIGRHSLEFLKEHYRNYLFKEYLPFWQEFGIDHELGGFMCGIDHDGKRTGDSKLMWYQGRGLWTYSYLYRCFGGEENLQVATKAKDFLLENGRDKDVGVFEVAAESNILTKVLKDGFKSGWEKVDCNNLYGDGNTVNKIIELLKTIKISRMVEGEISKLNEL